jgi:endo-1,4-beta-mannosidase
VLVHILKRYRNEPTILAWDLRDAGDQDYLADGSQEFKFDRETVLDWLMQTAILARQTDPNHPVTASWRSDIETTIPAVDFVSFQHFGHTAELRQRIADLKSQTDKPILLSAVGYSTFEGVDELIQRNLLYQTLDAAEGNALAGWVVWMAFDYPLSVTCDTPGCLSEDSTLHHFGLWNTSYFPKMAVAAVEEITGVK